MNLEKAMMMCLRLEQGAPGWKMDTNSLSYNGPKQGFTTDKFIWNDSVKTFDRFGKYLGCKVYFIKEGYQGMVDGGSNIVEAEWSSVSGIINKGGTVIGSARCLEFREKEGRIKAAKNLVDRWELTHVVYDQCDQIKIAKCL